MKLEMISEMISEQERDLLVIFATDSENENFPRAIASPSI